jgi:hypothetical protein
MTNGPLDRKLNMGLVGGGTGIVYRQGPFDCGLFGQSSHGRRGSFFEQCRAFLAGGP